MGRRRAALQRVAQEVYHLTGQGADFGCHDPAAKTVRHIVPAATAGAARATCNEARDDHEARDIEPAALWGTERRAEVAAGEKHGYTILLLY